MVILRGDPIDLWPMVALPEQPSGRCEHIRFDATGNLPAIDVTTDVRKKVHNGHWWFGAVEKNCWLTLFHWDFGKIWKHII